MSTTGQTTAATPGNVQLTGQQQAFLDAQDAENTRQEAFQLQEQIKQDQKNDVIQMAQDNAKVSENLRAFAQGAMDAENKAQNDSIAQLRQL